MRLLIILAAATAVAAFSWSDVKHYLWSHGDEMVDTTADIASKIAAEGVKRTVHVTGYVATRIINATS